MINGGILTKDYPVELLDGVIVQKVSKNPPRRNRNAGNLTGAGTYL
jgi:hypothetical protein